MKRMVLWLVIAGCLAVAATGAAAKGGIVEFPATGPEAARLIVWATIDLDAARPLIGRFQEERPDVAIVYREMETRKLHEEAIGNQQEHPDLIISSAMDLQVKFVNDGHARPHASEATARLPPWANWRNEAFAITLEPAVIVYNADFAKSFGAPRSRDALASLLAARAEELRGKVATYDISESGIGYLYATHDSLRSGNFGALIRSFGLTDVRLYCCTSDILAAIERGDILVGYNLLGSYAASRRRHGAPIEIVMPEDFTLVMSRVAVIPRKAMNPGLAGAFIDFLLSPDGQSELVRQGLSDANGQLDAGATGGQAHGDANRTTIQPIAVSPALLVFLDRIKQERFIRNWRELLGGPANVR